MANGYAKYSGIGGGGSGGVTSLNGETGAITLVAGSGISITPAGTNITIASTGGGGTVTSVGLADGSTTPIYSISGSPVTTSGTLTFTLNNKNANLVFAGPSSGGAAQPTFRSLVAADIPSLSGTYANTNLSNLSSPTAINQDLIPAGQYTQNIGSATNSYFLGFIRILQDSSGISAVNILGRTLINSSGVTLMTFSSSNINFGNNVLNNAADPLVAQDVATKNYVDTHAGTGTVTSVSVVSANGFAGTVATPTTTPAITISTTVTGILQGNGTAISAATTGNLTDAGTDGITITGGTGAVLGSGTSISQHVADTTHNGYLSSTDWNTFNGKGSGTVTSVAMTVPAFLSVAGSPITTSGTLAVSLSGTALPVANGGTGATSFSSNQVIIAGTTPTGAMTVVPGGTSGYILTSNGPTAAPTFQPAPGTVSQFFASSQVTTTSTAISSGSFTTFSNSPAFTFTPSITGTYKVYTSMPVFLFGGTGTDAVVRAFNTSGSATLLQESQAEAFLTTGSGQLISNQYVQSVYTLTAGTPYQFDLQGKVIAGVSVELDGANAPFYMFAELEAVGTSSTNAIRTITTSQTLLLTDNFVLCNSASPLTVTLPASGTGQLFNIKNINTGTVTITPTSGTIDGSASATMPVRYTSLELVFDGTNWWVT